MLRGFMLIAAACGASAFMTAPSLSPSILKSASKGIPGPMNSLSFKRTSRSRLNMAPAINMETILYGSRQSRSPLVEWMLVETGTPYTHREDRQGLPNPFGQIPAMIDGSVEIFESGAILLYIADKYDTKVKTPEDRAKYTKWVVWANSALDKSLFTPNIERAAPPYLDILNQQLEGKEWLAGDFSAADVAVASYLLFIPMFHPQFVIARWPNVLAYMERCVSRAGYQKAFTANAPRASAYVKAQKEMAAPKKAFGLF